MLVPKEVIRPGTYYYRDEATGLPRKLVVTPELCKYWHEQGNKMLSLGLTIPVPFEHDFNAHPMTPTDKLKNNAGWVKEYTMQGDALFSTVDIQDDEIAKKLPKTIRWTSPWISSFTDGAGRNWPNVISHLALTTRPRITKQAPFGSISAAMSFMTQSKAETIKPTEIHQDGFTLSKAGRLIEKDKKLKPEFPMAFSLYIGGIKLADEDMPPVPKKKESDDGEAKTDDGLDGLDGLDVNPLADQNGDVKMEELLADLMGVLGVELPPNVNEGTFQRALYTALVAKIKEMGATMNNQTAGAKLDNNNQPNTGSNQTPPNPLIQQEQQPMYMSLEKINQIQDESLRNVALSMHSENQKMAGQLASLRDAKLKEENAKRQQRVDRLCRMSPSLKNDLAAMFVNPSMALSMGEGGAVIDPMAQTLAMLEKGLADMPRLLTTETQAFAVQPQPTDGELTVEQMDEIADGMARMMGCPPQQKKVG